MFIPTPLDPIREFNKTPRNREQEQREYDKDDIHNKLSSINRNRMNSMTDHGQKGVSFAQLLIKDG